MAGLRLPNELWDIIFLHIAEKYCLHYVHNIIFTSSQFYRIAIRYLYQYPFYKTLLSLSIIYNCGTAFLRHPFRGLHVSNCRSRCTLDLSTSPLSRTRIQESGPNTPRFTSAGRSRNWPSYNLDKVIPFLRTLTKLHTVEFRGINIPSTSFANLDTVPGLKHLVLNNVAATLPTDLVLNNACLTSVVITGHQSSADILCSLLSLLTLRVLKLEWNPERARAVGTWIRGSLIEQEGQLHDIVSEPGHRTFAPLEEVHITATGIQRIGCSCMVYEVQRRIRGCQLQSVVLPSGMFYVAAKHLCIR
ncbi:hypothetical protein WG66_007849 [Moniliophthora roreri]|nr:hypothetical protein WG66_007849 [Moniliophthora roreri]